MLSMNFTVLSGCIVKVTSPINGPAGIRHSTWALMLLPLRLVSRKVQTPTVESISWAEIFTFGLGGIAAVALAGNVLRVISGQRKIVPRRRGINARSQGKTDAAAYWRDEEKEGDEE